MLLNLQYAAGIFDGEGFFNIDKTQRKDCKAPSYQVHARLTMRDQIIIESLRDTFSGSIRKVASRSPKHADYYSWDVCGEGVVAFVGQVCDFLIVKKVQSRLAVLFQEEKRKNKAGRPNSPERIHTLESFYQNMREANKKGVSRQ
jgi:hypothetical protein